MVGPARTARIAGGSAARSAAARIVSDGGSSIAGSAALKPVLSIGTKKKERVGDFKNPGRT
ncbi:MAG: hypothetical protein ACRD3T_09430 [Terriglobia bacterium]